MTQTSLDLPDIDEPIGAVELRCCESGHRFVLGLDEVGRGPLAGPVTVGGVILDLEDLSWCEGLDDSKKLSVEARGSWLAAIREHAIAAAIEHVHVDEIATLNILGASLEGMRRVAARLLPGVASCELALVDGNRAVPGLSCEQITIVKGDARSFAIAAASVLAKVTRDAWMHDAHTRFRVYGFSQHKGYPTRQHREALIAHGPCAIHRRNFRPVLEAAELHRLDT